jgi:hypothetical protein
MNYLHLKYRYWVVLLRCPFQLQRCQILLKNPPTLLSVVAPNQVRIRPFQQPGPSPNNFISMIHLSEETVPAQLCYWNFPLKNNENKIESFGRSIKIKARTLIKYLESSLSKNFNSKVIDRESSIKRPCRNVCKKISRSGIPCNLPTRSTSFNKKVCKKQQVGQTFRYNRRTAITI